MEYRADQQTPDRLAWLASLAGAEFADAVETIEPLLGPPSEVVLSFSAIQENGLATKFPREVLSLVHALVPADVDRFNNWRIHLLPEVLQDVAAADTSLENDLRFRRLRDTAIRAGLSFPPASQPNNPVTPRASTNE